MFGCTILTQIFMICNFYAYTESGFTLTSISGAPNELMAVWEESMNNAIVGYEVFCSTSASQPYPEQMIGSNAATLRSEVDSLKFNTIITGLNPYTNYDCYVLTDLQGETSMSNVATARTDESSECDICFTRIRLKPVSAL